MSLHDELGGKVALVTGGAAGIGKAIAVELASAGADIVIFDRAGARDAVAAVEATGRRAVAVAGDVSSEADVAGAVEAAATALGGVDVLVNNAGLFATLRPGPFEEITVDDWRRVMDVNVLGAFLAARAVTPAMRERGGGRIVNIASTTAFKGVAHLLHYVSSKGALLAMTKALARELGGDGILVNAVAPGFTVSDGVEEHQDRMRVMRDRAPGGRVLAREMTPDDVVGAVRYLAGPLSRFVTGQTIVVDGGAFFH